MMALAVLVGCLARTDRVAAAEETTILPNIYIGTINVGGMTRSEAEAAISSYVEDLSDMKVTLDSPNEDLTLTGKDIGLEADLSGTVEKAIRIGNSGNIVSRFTETQDMTQTTLTYEIDYTVDETAVRTLLEQNQEKLENEPIDWGLTRTNGAFVIVEGQEGTTLKVSDFFNNTWDKTSMNVTVELVSDVSEVKGSREELEVVQDVLGTFSTNYSDSIENRKANVALATSFIDGTILYPGESFSVEETISPISSENGYLVAAGYEGDTVVDAIGGGVCQVATTLYDAALYAELQIDQRNNHSMIVTYVDYAFDAAIAEGYKDVKFTNTTDYPIYIEGTADGSTLTFTIYGKETRAANRTVEYVSQTLDYKAASVSVVVVDEDLGYVKGIQGGHPYAVAQLVKNVYVDGVLTESSVVNTSSYKTNNTIWEIGMNCDNAEAIAEVNEAIATADPEILNEVIQKWAQYYGTGGYNTTGERVFNSDGTRVGATTTDTTTTTTTTDTTTNTTTNTTTTDSTSTSTNTTSSTTTTDTTSTSAN